MKVGVIGAGPSGLVSAKLLSDEGIHCDVFERNSSIGGTWIYNEHFIDKHGLPTSSSIYKNLKTNLPKELMLFEGLNYDIDGVSYITSDQVLKYLTDFANKFHLLQQIKFEHLVKNISRREDVWELLALDLKTGYEDTYFYDSIFVCNGHYSVPLYPDISGSGSFPSSAIHSHYYRVPEVYKDRTVLIIGNGPSAVDIAFDICPFSKLVYLSHHGPDSIKTQFPENIIHKPDVKFIDGSSIHFVDDTEVVVDAILYCTGYKYSIPFLDDSCGIKVEDDKYIYPLFKQLVSIPHSSMFFIGLPFSSFLFQLFELQAKCAINILKNKVDLISKEEMMADTHAWEQSLAARGHPKMKYHMINDYLKEYFSEISELGHVKPYPDVLFKLYYACSFNRKQSLSSYRNKVVRIIDSNSFVFE